METGKEFARLKPKTAEPVFTEAEESAVCALARLIIHVICAVIDLRYSSYCI